MNRERLADRLSPPIRCAPRTDLELLIAYMCPYGLQIDISTSLFPHFWQVNSRKSQDLAWEACSVQEKRIKRQQTVSSAGCKVFAPNPGFLLASMPSYCRFRPIEGSYSQSVSVSVHQDKIRGSAIWFSLLVPSGTTGPCSRRARCSLPRVLRFPPRRPLSALPPPLYGMETPPTIEFTRVLNFLACRQYPRLPFPR